MVKDRLQEFKAESQKAIKEKGGAISSREADELSQLIIASTSKSITPTPLANLLTSIDLVRQKVDSLHGVLSRIKNLHVSILSSPTEQPEKSKLLASETREFEKDAKEARDTVRKLIQTVNKLPTQDIQFRIGKNHLNAISRNLEHAILEFNNQQVEYKEKCQKRIANYLSISGIKIPEDEIDQAIEGGQFFSTAQVLMGEREKKMLFEDVKSRHDDIIRIEKSIREMNEIFQDMSLLIRSQDEMVDRIGTNTENAQEYVRQAQKNVQDAKRARKRATKLKIAFGIFIIILIIILIMFIRQIICSIPFVCKS